jgi:2-oxoglutarate dehydrogenase E2 component (dihydrolipoamide succinyltransferase)
MEVKVPQLPESVADATLVAWHRKVGDAVRRDENLVDLETDKVVLEVPAPADGVIAEIRAQDGATVVSGDVLAIIEPGAVAEAAAAPAAGAAAKTEAATAAAAVEPSTGGAAERPAEPGRQAAPEPEPGPEPQAGDSGPHRMGPAVRKLLDEHDIDPATISGTGRDGRITKTDVIDYLAQHRDTHVGIDFTAAIGGGAVAGERLEQRVAMTRLRARIAERLVEAQQTAAMLTTFNEIDMSEVVALRKRHQDAFMARYEIKLGFMSFFVRAAIEALREFPMINASVDGNEIIYHDYFDIGVAVSTERGLVVPVLRDAQTMSFADIERAIADFGQRARSGALQMDELTGGTFTITNGGIFGSLMSTPILNPPQSGILGMHAIQQRPVVVDGAIEARPMMYIALTYDHRIVDGREAVQFLVQLKRQLEDPARLILQI